MDASIRLLAIPCGTRDTLFGRSPSACFSEHLCSSGPTCLLIDRARAPMVFVGVTVPPVGGTSDLKGGRSGRQRFDPASGLRSRGRSVSPVSMRSDIDEHGDRSCLGLSLFQGSRTRPAFASCACTSCGLVPASASSASGDRISRSRDPLVGVTASLPGRTVIATAAAGMILFLPGLLVPGRDRLPFSVLRG
jgi:hypothetical protein